MADTANITLTKQARMVSITVEGIQQDDWTVKEFEERLLSKHGYEARQLTWCGALVGWKIRFMSPDSLTLIAPDGATLPLSTGRLKPRPRDRDRLLGMILEHGDPVKVGLIQNVDGVPGVKGWDREQLPDFTVEIEFENREKRARFIQAEASEQVSLTEAEQMVRTAPINTTEDDVVIVSSQPFLAHEKAGKNGLPGIRYPSKVIVERHWSDGSIDFKCSLCDFVRQSPSAITSHWKKHVRDGSAQRQTEITGQIEDPAYDAPMSPRQAGTYTPRPSRVKELAAFLATLDPNLTEEELAEEVLRWFHDRDQLLVHGTKAEPMTDAQVIDAIRRLVDRGELARRENALLEHQHRLAEVTQQLEAVRSEAARDKARADDFEAKVALMKELWDA